MADNSYRSDRGRDPLAELARLIGQRDASSGGQSRETVDPPRPRAPAARDVDWAPDDRYAAPEPDTDTRYAAPLPSAPSYPSSSSDYYAPQQAQDPGYRDRGYQDPGYQDAGYQEQGHQGQGYRDQGYRDQGYRDQGYRDQGYQDQAYQDQAYQDQGSQDRSYHDQGYVEPAGSRFFSGPAGQFNGFREEPSHGLQNFYDETLPQLPSARDLSAYASAPDPHGYRADEHQYTEDEAAPADHDYQETRNPGRRTALVAVMAIFGLVVVGSAGAFGYRAMFGGSVLPTLPPIIKASNGPNKIALDPQAGAASNAAQAVATTGSTENLVSREEQPVTIDAPKSAPRVVSTIPIVTNGQSVMPPGMSGMPPATIGQTGPNRVAAADSPWPAPPSTLPAPAPAAAPAAAPPAPVPVSSEPKKIHTVTIRADQTGAVPDAAAAPAASGAARAQSRPAAVPRAAAPAAGGGAAPMSIVPAQGDAAPAPPPRPRTAVASTAPSATPSSGGSSYAQVTSRRTEGEAQTEFRALEARFPTQLSGREPVIRRADLGEKGIYYRALVGPFASTEEAAQLCSSLKAAGQNCIVQRN
jgi:SPOR domain